MFTYLNKAEANAVADQIQWSHLNRKGRIERIARGIVRCEAFVADQIGDACVTAQESSGSFYRYVGGASDTIHSASTRGMYMAMIGGEIADALLRVATELAENEYDLYAELCDDLYETNLRGEA